MADEYVHIGNLVTFESENGDLLSVDVCGVITWVSAQRSVPSDFDRCIWRICDKLSYTDQGFLSNIKTQASTSTIDVEALKRQALREQYRNNSDLAHPSGKEVRYGSIVQIQHVITGKFMSASNTPAKLSRECLDVYLDEGSEAVYFKVRPRYKVRSDGGVLLEHDVILLSSHISPGYNVHESVINKNDIAPISHTLSKIEEGVGENSIGDLIRESNLSRNASACGITINVYQVPSSKYDDHFLHVRQHVRLFDRENNGFIVSCSGHGSGTGVDAVQMQKGNSTEAVSTSESPYVKPLSSNDRDPTHPDEFSSNQLWAFEHAPSGKRRQGGFVEWSKAQYRVKHIASGRYLTAGTKVVKHDRNMHNNDKTNNNNNNSSDTRAFTPLKEEDEVEDEFRLDLTLEKSATDLILLSRQIFCFQVVDSKQHYIPKNDAFISLCHTTAKGNIFYAHMGHVNQSINLSSINHS